MLDNNNASIYIHWPFCISKCPYCDFNSHVSKNSLELSAWKKAYQKEIDREAENVGKIYITSIFFGGGTPSLMHNNLIEFLLNHIQKKWVIAPNAEITLEANPSSSEMLKFKTFSKLGINRLSLGLQSLNDNSLNFLGRSHSAKEGLKALEYAKNCFSRVSFDLIYGLPDQTEKIWKEELLKAIYFSGEHISAYQLTIEKGTSFNQQFRNKQFKLPSEKILLNLYTMTEEILNKNKFLKYEVSNYCKKNAISIHNTNIWKGHQYFGFGPGAHGRMIVNNKWRATQRYPSPVIWFDKTSNYKNSLLKHESITGTQRAKEILLTGLRLTSGIKLSEVKKLCNINNFEKIIDKNFLQTLIKNKFINNNDNTISVTKKGFPVLNSIIRKLII